MVLRCFFFFFRSDSGLCLQRGAVRGGCKDTIACTSLPCPVPAYGPCLHSRRVGFWQQGASCRHPQSRDSRPAYRAGFSGGRGLGAQEREGRGLVGWPTGRGLVKWVGGASGPGGGGAVAAAV